VARTDRDAVRRRRERRAGREFTIWGDGASGVMEVSGTLATTDAYAVDERLTALAATVCEADPRTLAQRRADAMGALAAGAGRLACRCGGRGCPARSQAGPSPGGVYGGAEQSRR